MEFPRANGPSRAAFGLLALGLLLITPLVFYRGFSDQFTYIKLILTKTLVLVGTAGLAVAVARGALRFPGRSRLMGSLVLLAVAVLVSCWNSPLRALSFIEAEYFLCGPLWLLLMISWGGGEARVRWLATLTTVAGAVVAAIALLQWAGHDPLLFGGYRVEWGTMVQRMRLYSTFGNPNFVAGYLIGAIFPALGVAGTASKLRFRAAWCIVVAAVFAAIVGTRSRGAWVGLAAGLLIARAIWRRRGASATPPPVRAVTGNAAVVKLPGWILPLGVAVLISSLGLLMQALLTHFEGRVYLWRASWPMFAEHPLLGSGWGTFQLRFLDLQARFLATHPDLVRHWSHIRQLHNDPLHILLEAGAVGFVGFGWVLWTYGRETRQALDAAAGSMRLWLGVSAGGVTAILVDSLFNFQFAIPPTFLLLFTLLAFPSLLSVPHGPGKTLSEPETPEGGRERSSLRFFRVLAAVAVLGLVGVLLFRIARRAAAEHDYSRAVELERQGDLTRAELIFRQGLRRAPLDGRLHYGLARVLYRDGQFSEALAETLLAERTYADSHLEVLKARIQDQMGLFGSALLTYRHALALDPTLKSVRADIERLRSAQL